MSDCRKCARFEECLVDEDCGIFVKKSMTNTDRIRTMTDEELAQHLYWWDNSPLHASLERWLDWLKEEIDNE